jgi:hypothetical protein
MMGGMRGGTGRIVLVASFFLGVAALHGEVREQSVPDKRLSLPKDVIAESFLAYLVGLIRADVPAELSRNALLALFPEFQGKNSTPFQLISRVARLSAEGADRPPRLLFSFSDELHVPVPFVVPWYHPITIDASDTVILRETRRASRTFGSESGDDVVLAPVYEYRMEKGSGRIHFDDWLIVLSGGFLDDFTVQGAALFIYKGEWHGLIAGRNPRNRVIAWLFNLRRMRLVFPLPRELRGLASDLIGE